MEKQPAYVLHSRNYRESSALVDLFTPEYGLIRCIGRGIKKQISKGHTLQPFTPYEISFHGQSDLKTLEYFEPSNIPIILRGDALFSGFYVNEVLIRALRSEADVEAEQLFDAYENVLLKLNTNVELTLRLFELTLLEHMGQSYEWGMDFKTGLDIEPNAHYGFFPEQGMSRVSKAYAEKQPNMCFLGLDLIHLANCCLDHPSTLNMSKRLLRLALKPIIGFKPLQARELLKKFREIGS